jgi:C4-dicarboxylate transporter, DctQ subunit
VGGGLAMSNFRNLTRQLEESAIALLLAAMTIVTFSQVVARYVFNSGWPAALELTTIMFAWLVLFGASYAMRIGAHLGVDILIRLLPTPVYRAMTVLGAGACIVYAGILFYGSCGNPFATGHICDAGYVGKMYAVGLKTTDLHWPRWAVYAILPIGMVLFALRAGEAAVMILRGRRDGLAAGHEAEDLLREQAATAPPRGPAAD